MTRPAHTDDAPDAPDTFARDCYRAAHALAFEAPEGTDPLLLAAAGVLLTPWAPLTQRHGSNGALRASAYVPLHSPPYDWRTFLRDAVRDATRDALSGPFPRR